MKRFCSLFVTLALVLSLLPGAAWAAQAEPQDPPPEEAAAQLQQAPEEPTPEEPTLEEPFLLFDPEWEEPEAGPDEEETAALFASSPDGGTVSGTVSLPSGCTAQENGYVYVYLYTPAELDNNGQILTEPALAYRTMVNFTKGQSSGTFTISNVQTGDYILRTYSYVYLAGVFSGERYYSADGAAVENKYAAKPLTVTGSHRVNLTLPAAPRSISGTLTFDGPAAEDSVISVYLYDNTAGVSKSYYSRLTVKAGDTEADFAVGVEPGNYYIQFYNSGTSQYGYCGIYGNLSSTSSERLYFNTRDESLSGLSFNGSSLLVLSEDPSEEPVETINVSVTVTLPAAAAEEREYLIVLMDKQGMPLSDVYCSVEAGKASFSGSSLTVKKGQTFCVYYCDVTDCDVVWLPSVESRYAAEDGITTNISKAKAFTAEEDTAVALTEPACYAVTGTLSRSDFQMTKKIAGYALAEFADGERYAARVVFPEGTQTAQYTIYVPQSQNGNEFSISAGFAQSGTGNIVQDTSIVTGGDYTLNGNMAVDGIVLAGQESVIWGRFSLPAGISAPEGGLVVNLGIVNGYSYEAYAAYYLPAGQSGFAYEFGIPVQEDAVTVYAEIKQAAAAAGVYYRTMAQFAAGDLTGADLTAVEAVTISGAVTVPEACRDGAATVSVGVSGTWNGNYVYSSVYVSMLPGAVSVPYSIQMPKDIVLSQAYVRLQGDSQDTLSTALIYLRSDGTTGTGSASLSLTVSEDLTVNFSLQRGRFLSGTLSLPEGLSAGEYWGTVRVAREDGSESYSQYFDFTGSSYDYRVSLPGETEGEYLVSVYMYGGTGTVLYTYYYYSTGGMTSDRTKATPVTIGADGAKLDLTVPKAKLISGTLVSADGDAVEWDPERTMSFRMYQGDGSSQSYSVAVDARGNWSFTVDPELTGEYVLMTSVSSGVQSNIISKNYYSSADGQVCTSLSDASPITVGAGDVTGVKLYVETGWVLSGSVLLPDGGYLTGGTVSVSMNAKSSSGAYAYGSAEVGAAGGSYRIVVPKTEETYTITMNNTSPSSGISTNLYFGSQTLSDVSVAGDTSGLDFTLEKAKAVITGTVYRPAGVSSSMGLFIFVKGNRGNYSSYIYLSTNSNSAGFSIPIPSTETSETYQVYYYITSTVPGIVSGSKKVYMCEDGSLTTNSNQAGSFDFADNRTFSFTLLEVEPFAKGKIYCPDGLTENITVYVGYAVSSATTAFSVAVGPDCGQVDADGRRYSTYSLVDAAMTAGSAYRLIYWVDEPSGLVDTYSHYLNADGTVADSAAADVFTVSAGGANVVDFTPLLWDDGSENFILQSAHGIDSSLGTVTYTYTYPTAADSLTVTFSDRTDTGLTINGTYYNSYRLAAEPVTVSGNTLTVTMTPANSSYLAYGFAVTEIKANGGGTLTAPAAPAVYTEAGGTAEQILSGLNHGETVRVSLVSGGSSETATAALAGVIYDANGKMLDFVSVQVDLSSGSATAGLSFEKYGEAATLKLLLADQEWIPQMKNLTFRAQ